MKAARLLSFLLLRGNTISRSRSIFYTQNSVQSFGFIFPIERSGKVSMTPMDPERNALRVF